MKIKAKLVLSTIITAAIVFCGVIGVNNYLTRQTSIENVNKMLDFVSLDTANEIRDSLNAGVMAQTDYLLWVSIVSGLIGLLFLGLVTWYMAGQITKNLAIASRFLFVLAKGNFSINISDEFLNLKDEVGDMSRAVNKMQSSIRIIIQKMAEAIQELAASSQELSATTDNVSATMQEITATTEEISANMEVISISSREIAASGQDMNREVTCLQVEMTDASRKAKEVEVKAENIYGKVLHSQSSAQQIYSRLNERMLNAIEKAKVVNEISSMADLISDLAEQTNLLALNAAIEAARAGEQGRGFAVVAEEVRKLAEESAKTVSDIKKVTNDVQVSIGSLIKDSSELLNFMTTDVQADYKAFLDIASQYKNDANTFYKTNDVAANMGSRVLKVVTGVSAAVQETTVSLEQSSEGSQQIAKVTEETSRVLIEINEASMKLSRMAEELTLLIGQFKT